MREVEYLDTPIAAIRETGTPRYGMTAAGYTVKRGAPSRFMIRLNDEKRWRRLMVWQFSNAGTLFIRVHGRELIVREHMLPN